MPKIVGLFFSIILSTLSFAAEPFTVLAGRDAEAPKQPQACVDAKGVVHVTFGGGEQVYYCSIEPDQSIQPSVAFRIPNMSLGMRRGPRIAHSGKSIVITAIGGPQGKGRDGDVLAYRSFDNGKNWLGPAQVNGVAASAREGLHAMTACEDGTLWCVWLDLREQGTQLFGAKSSDGGATWSKNQLVYRSPDGSVCECCHPSILADQDSVHVLFRNSLRGNRDMYVVSSLDRGTTFGAAVPLGQDNWRLNACPMDGGMLAIDNVKQLSTVWRRAGDVFLFSPQVGRETRLGTGEQPWIASDGEVAFTVWTTQREGALLLTRSDRSSQEKLSDVATFPIVVASQLPKPTVVVLWETRSDQTYSILGYRVH
jgi:BNR repeat-like domain